MGRKEFTAADIAEYGEFSLPGSFLSPEKPLGNFWMDSRRVSEGDVFIAFETERDDGHRYVESALAKGASAALVNKSKLSMFDKEISDKLIPVDDTLTALQDIALGHRKHLDTEVIAVTGSNGKTTTRNFTGKVFSSEKRTWIPPGSWNNHIGVPLSLLRIRGDVEYALIEMGTNHPGEIGLLSSIARPDMSIITNVGYAHIGNFGSLEATAEEKTDIVKGMDSRSGSVLVNRDDSLLYRVLADKWENALTFGIENDADFRAEDIRTEMDAGNLVTRFKVGGAEYQINAAGVHFVYNALAAISAGSTAGIRPESIVSSLKGIYPGPMRGAVVKYMGVTYIPDCYNANPTSMEYALKILAVVPCENRRIAVVGDMLELGSFSEKEHTELGRKMDSMQIDVVVAVGKYAGLICREINGAECFSAPDSDSCIGIVREILEEGDTVLLKASRGVALEKILYTLGVWSAE